MLHESQLACPYCLQLHLQLPFAAVVANDMQTLHYECYYKISLAEAAIVCVCVCMHLNDSIYHKMAAKQQHASKQ